MEECCYRTSRGMHVPAFGSWDCEEGNDLPFTQCFETARPAAAAGFFPHYSYSSEKDHNHGDLYVAGDLYQNNVVTPAMIVVPRRRNKALYSQVTEDVEKKQHCWEQYGYEGKEPPSPPSPMPRPTPKAVDDDLYKISPGLLQDKPKKKRLGFFSSCLLPTCDA